MTDFEPSWAHNDKSSRVSLRYVSVLDLTSRWRLLNSKQEKWDEDHVSYLPVQNKFHGLEGRDSATQSLHLRLHWEQ